MPVKKTPEDKDACMVKITFGYSNKYIFPYDQGIALMGCFKNAEEWDSSDHNNPTIKPLESSPEMTIISKEHYQEMKMRELLVGTEED